MENASKALIIAAGVLIAILLLSIFTYLMSSMSASSSNIYSTLEESEITEFNQQYFNYEGRTNLVIQDVITIINMAKDSNQRGQFPEVKVYVDSREVTNEDVNNMLSSQIDKTFTFQSAEINTATRLVYKVNIITN